eukprot:scaffold1535_cov382-Prasinococcus_capsulatus_cf.AAC.12
MLAIRVRAGTAVAALKSPQHWGHARRRQAEWNVYAHRQHEWRSVVRVLHHHMDRKEERLFRMAASWAVASALLAPVANPGCCIACVDGISVGDP